MGIILLGFWLIYAWYKIYIQNAPPRMFWWSAAGLGITSLGLITRNVFLLTSMFCALFITEGLWTLSFIANLAFRGEDFFFAKYAFNKTYPTIGFIITQFHLILIPSIIFALLKLRKTSRYGWLGAYVFALTVSYLAYYFPDKEDINCVRGTNEACRFYFQHLYDLNPTLRIFIAATIQLLIFFIPLNLLVKSISSLKKRFQY